MSHLKAMGDLSGNTSIVARCGEGISGAECPKRHSAVQLQITWKTSVPQYHYAIVSTESSGDQTRNGSKARPTFRDRTPSFLAQTTEPIRATMPCPIVMFHKASDP